MSSWLHFVATAPTAAVFAARLKEGSNVLRKYDLNQIIRYINQRIDQSLYLYFKRNARTCLSAVVKSRFCQWLQQNGIDKAVMQAYRDKL